MDSISAEPTSRAEFLRKMPKIELHCHHEGSVAPELALHLGERHGVDLSQYMTSDGRYAWTNFNEFLHSYDAISAVIKTIDDYMDLTLDYYRRCAAEGLVYGEFFVSPAHAARYGLSYATLIDALAEVARTLEGEGGPVIRAIITCVRHYGPEHAQEIARLIESNPHPMVVGFGMGGDEAQHHPRDFAPAFERAAASGLHLTSHAGEVMGPQSVRDTIEHLKVERLGHGVRATEDPALLGQLIDQQMPFEVCPSSNLALGLYPSIADHPIGDMFRAGAKVTISADDPPFFGCTIGQEYAAVAVEHGLSDEQMMQITRNALDAAFCDEPTRATIAERIETLHETVINH